MTRFRIALAVAAIVAGALVGPASWTPAAAEQSSGIDTPPISVRFALVVGSREVAGAPDFGEMLADERFADYLSGWDLHHDHPEIRRLFALRGLSEVTRQSARLQPGGGDLAGGARIGESLWRIELDVRPQSEVAEFRVRVLENGALQAAPKILSRWGEKAIVSVADAERPLFVFVVVEADRGGDRSSAVAGEERSGPGDETSPRAVRMVQPGYPEEERSARRQGEVVLDLEIDATGRVTSAAVARGLSPAFDEAARQAALQWEFEPATRGGVPVATTYSVTFRFRLK